MIRLGGPTYGDTSTPEKWVETMRSLGYTAAYCPVKDDADADTIAAYVQAAAEADIVIAEVGAWSNPLDVDKETAKAAIALCQQRLDLAERIGARCCVNIAGSRGPRWDGPHPDNLSADTFDLVVETVREIIDAVKPTRTFYTLEPMPWVFPDSPASYERLVHAINRPAFGVHLDPVNWTSSPQLYYDTAGLIRESFSRLGPYIKSCHAKDIILADRLTVHLDETVPGRGALSYRTLLQELNRLPGDISLMLEHLPNAEEYKEAAEYVRQVAASEGIPLR